jgi:Protein of unknown function (DUF2844)
MGGFRSAAVALLGVSVLLVMEAPRAAFATLGEPAASVISDASRMGAAPPASESATQAPGSQSYSVEQFTTPAGVRVSEYIAPGGTVFAVSWHGRTPPDVAALLGAYFKQYQDAASAGSPTKYGLHHSSVAGPDVVVQTAGHMGNMFGRAYLPAMLPPGVDESEIR